MLDKILDKLRDKTLSFGCIIRNNAKLEERYDLSQGKSHIYKVIGHPLTRGRIDYLYQDYKKVTVSHPLSQSHIALSFFFRDNHILYNQSELERQTHEKRPELRELLIQFSNYL